MDNLGHHIGVGRERENRVEHIVAVLNNKILLDGAAGTTYTYRVFRFTVNVDKLLLDPSRRIFSQTQIVVVLGLIAG